PEPELRAVRREIGFVFQRFNLVQRLSAEQNVMLGLLAGGESPNRARARAAGALERVGLAHLAKRRPSEMSGGEQQRVGIARALALRPKLMLWDEPTAALDPMLCEEVLGVMEDLAASHETTMLIATHELPFAWRAADRIVLMEAGRIVDAGTPRAVLLEPKSALARRYRRMCEVRYGGLPAGWEGGPNGRSLLARAETL
ncbi:MAG TPA: ATP-binding cassette domain-containing protein, partial [Limnochordia bacterium]|nr:ATP-binding cassette domain-containing protein [Limnochordia bacterium]